MPVDRWKCEECYRPCELAITSPAPNCGSQPSRDAVLCPLGTEFVSIWFRVSGSEPTLGTDCVPPP